MPCLSDSCHAWDKHFRLPTDVTFHASLSPFLSLAITWAGYLHQEMGIWQSSVMYLQGVHSRAACLSLPLSGNAHAAATCRRPASAMGFTPQSNFQLNNLKTRSIGRFLVIPKYLRFSSQRQCQVFCLTKQGILLFERFPLPTRNSIKTIVNLDKQEECGGNVFVFPEA